MRQLSVLIVGLAVAHAHPVVGQAITREKLVGMWAVKENRITGEGHRLPSFRATRWSDSTWRDEEGKQWLMHLEDSTWSEHHMRQRPWLTMEHSWFGPWRVAGDTIWRGDTAYKFTSDSRHLTLFHLQDQAMKQPLRVLERIDAAFRTVAATKLKPAYLVGTWRKSRKLADGRVARLQDKSLDTTNTIVYTLRADGTYIVEGSNAPPQPWRILKADTVEAGFCHPSRICQLRIMTNTISMKVHAIGTRAKHIEYFRRLSPTPPEMHQDGPAPVR